MSTIYDTRSTQATAHHATCVVTVEIWVTNAPIMLLPLALIGLTSGQNVVSRWIRHNFDTSVCFDGCNNISETLERLQHIRTNAATFHQDRV